MLLAVGGSIAFAAPEPGLGYYLLTTEIFPKEEPSPCCALPTSASRDHLETLSTLGSMKKPGNCFYQLSQSISMKYTGAFAYLLTPLGSLCWTIWSMETHFLLSRNTWKSENKQTHLHGSPTKASVHEYKVTWQIGVLAANPVTWIQYLEST